MSLDGYIAGDDDSTEKPLGDNGEVLHRWIYELESWRKAHGLKGGASNRDSEIIAEATENVGAVVLGRRMFDFGEQYWGENPPFHAPVFIVTNRPRPSVIKEGGTTYTFVTQGLQEALRLARNAAGASAVSIAGGAEIIQQCLKLGVLDEIQIHLVPVLLGSGRRLFNSLPDPVDLQLDRVVEASGVTHLRFNVGAGNR